MNSQARPSAICAGDRPRATSARISAIARSKSYSFLFTPLRASDRRPSASACARAAEYSQRRALRQPWRRCWQPLQVQGHARSRAQASSGTSAARSPLPGPFATVRLRLTSSEIEAGERPRSRATPRAEGLLLPKLPLDGGLLRPREPEVALLLPLRHNPRPFSCGGPPMGPPSDKDSRAQPYAFGSVQEKRHSVQFNLLIN